MTSQSDAWLADTSAVFIHGLQARAPPEALMRLVSQSPLPSSAASASAAKRGASQRRVAPTPVQQAWLLPTLDAGWLCLSMLEPADLCKINVVLCCPSAQLKPMQGPKPLLVRKKERNAGDEAELDFAITWGRIPQCLCPLQRGGYTHDIMVKVALCCRW